MMNISVEGESRSIDCDFAKEIIYWERTVLARFRSFQHILP